MWEVKIEKTTIFFKKNVKSKSPTAYLIHQHIYHGEITTRSDHLTDKDQQYICPVTIDVGERLVKPVFAFGPSKGELDD